jgi:hypothetical protein
VQAAGADVLGVLVDTGGELGNLGQGVAGEAELDAFGLEQRLVLLDQRVLRIRMKSPSVSDFSSTRMGKRPCSSGIMSLGLETWKAPAAMNRMWSVRTKPCRVLTVVPSTMGRMSRCTPSRLTSGPWPDSRPAILSISSRKMMPLRSTRSKAMRVTCSMSMSFCSSSWIR